MTIKPIFKPHTAFFDKYLNVPVVEMLKQHSFIVDEFENDDEDLVYFEQRNEFLLKNVGVSASKFDIKREFVAEFKLSELTSIFVEGVYQRKPTGEKMYNVYTYSFYKRRFLPNGAISGKRQYVEKRGKVQLLKAFEEQRMLFSKNEGG